MSETVLMSPAPMDLQAVGQRELRHFTSIDSTNTYMASLASVSDVPSMTTVWADHQSAGRGRYDRSWVDNPGHSLLLTTLVKVPTLMLNWVTLLAGIAMSRALQPADVSVKWPNDLILAGKKVGGMLSEHVGTVPIGDAGMTCPGDSIHQVIVGIGVNLGDAPDVPDGYPGSVPGFNGGDRRRVIGDFLDRYADLFALADDPAMRTPLSKDPAMPRVFDVWRQAYCDVMEGMGEQATIRHPDNTVEQLTVSGISLDGSLIADRGGKRTLITCGDVALAGMKLPPAP